MTAMNVAKPILDWMERDPGKVLLASPERTWSVTDLFSAAEARQSQLRAAGITVGDRVCVANRRGYAFWVDVIALWGMGAVAVFYESGMPQERGSAIVRKAQAKAFLGANADEARRLGLQGLPGAPDDGCASAYELRTPAPEDLACILFTSGSTGLPKAVPQSHAAVLGNALATQERVRLSASDRLFVATPYVFVSALSHFLVAVYSGATLTHTEDKLFKGDLVEGIKTARANAFGGAPIQVRWLCEASREHDLNLTWLMSSGDNLGVDVIDQVQENMPQARLYTVYGMTELAGRFCILDPADLERGKGAVGTPISGLFFSLIDEDSAGPVADGEIGEVVASGAFMFSGYLNDPEATEACVTDAGMKTGDLGVVDELGFLHLCGRTDDVFKVLGQKVSSLPIGEALMKTGMFADLAVGGLAHPVLGHAPYVYYVLAPGREFVKREVMSALRQHLPANHMPSGFEAVDEVPRTQSGKIQRAWLREVVRATEQRQSKD